MSPEQGSREVLKREHGVVEGLEGRLRELGERIQAGKPVSPDAVRFGLVLLDTYLDRVHARPFDVQLWVEAKAVAGRECRVPLVVARENHGEVRRSAQQILELVSRWADGSTDARDQVAKGLISLASVEEATNEVEECHPLAYLATDLPATTRNRAEGLFDDLANTKASLEADITRYLHDSRPGCEIGAEDRAGRGLVSLFASDESAKTSDATKAPLSSGIVASVFGRAPARSTPISSHGADRISESRTDSAPPSLAQVESLYSARKVRGKSHELRARRV